MADLGEAVVVGEVIIHGVHPVQGSVVVMHAITVLSPGDRTDESNRSPQPAEGLSTVLSNIDKTGGQHKLPGNISLPPVPSPTLLPNIGKSVSNNLRHEFKGDTSTVLSIIDKTVGQNALHGNPSHQLLHAQRFYQTLIKALATGRSKIFSD